MAKKGAGVSGSVQAIDLHDEFEMVLFEEPLRYSVFIYLAEKLQKVIFFFFFVFKKKNNSLQVLQVSSKAQFYVKSV